MAKTKQELAVITPEEQAYLDNLNKSHSAPAESGPAKLVINTQAKDAEGNRHAIGSWHISGTDKYYDGVAVFRPVVSTNKLLRYKVDGENYTVAGESTFFDNVREEIPDTLGTNALGRVFGKVYSEEERAANRKLAEYYMYVFGLVTFGDSDPEPVLLRVRGGKIMTLGNAFKSIPKGKQPCQYGFKLEAYQPEGKTYWDIKVTPDLSTTLPIAPVIAYDAAIRQYIQEENLNVIQLHQEAKHKVAGDALVAGNAKRPLVLDDLDDSLPF